MRTRLGSLAGIGVYLHWSFWILPAIVFMSSLSGGGGGVAAVTAVVFLFLVFGCVVLHELGHALAARYYGIGTRDITLYPIGGVANLDRIPEKPYQELVIAVAGPLVNVAIAGVLTIALVLTIGGIPGPAAAWAAAPLAGLLWVNIALVLFNMLPAFPMDGGRVLRSVLAMRLPYVRATRIAANVGKVMAILMAAVGLFWNVSLVFVAIFVYLAGSAEAAMVEMREAQRFRRAGFWPQSEAAPHTWQVDTTAGASEGSDVVWVSEVRTVDPGDGSVRVVRYENSPS